LSLNRLFEFEAMREFLESLGGGCAIRLLLLPFFVVPYFVYLIFNSEKHRKPDDGMSDDQKSK